jgi:transglutaminase-like putative cysteine protease
MVMSGRGRLALCAYAATLMAAASMLPLVSPAGWLVQAALLTALVSGAGALLRRVPLPRPLTVLLQAVLGLLLLTLAFARDAAPLGFVPTPDVIEEFGRLLTAGGTDVGQYAIPAPATNGIRLMLVGGVVVIGLAVDALAVTFRNAAPAGLPLLALYSVAAGLSQGTWDWLWFLIAACGYLLLLLAEGRDRLSQWGRVFGGAPRTPARAASGLDASGTHALAPMRTGRRIGVLALGIALVVPLALPALNGGLLGGVGDGDGTGTGGGGMIRAVNPLVTLQDDLNQPEDREALRYRTNAQNTQNLYLRIMSLDKFDGTSWRVSQRNVEDVPDQLPDVAGLDGDVGTTEIKTNITAAEWYRQDYLPMPYPASRVDIEGRWRFEPVGRTLVGDRGQTTRGTGYSVDSLQVNPTREQLESAPEPSAALRREYTEIPGNLPGAVKKTAQEVTAGATNDYQRAVKLQDWFSVNGGFTYDTDVDSGTGIQAITRFLKDKRGFCIHFSFTMAAMARTLGIPARVAVGFTPGTPQPDGSMSVGLRDAHAWPELYFQGVGWTQFEPTPGRGNVPDYTRQSVPNGGPTDSQQPAAGASATPSAAPSASQSCDARAKKLEACGAAAAQGATPGSGTGTPVWAEVLLSLAAAAVVLLLLLMPLLWRTRVRTRRLGSGGHVSPGVTASGTDGGREAAVGAAGAAGAGAGPPTAQATASRTLSAWRELTDSAWDHGVPPDESQTPRGAAARIVLLGRLDQQAADAVHRVADSVEQVLYAPVPRPGVGLAEDIKRVRDGLHASADRRTRLRALLLPRSSVRVIWALSERWTAVAERWGTRRQGMGRWVTTVGRRRG